LEGTQKIISFQYPCHGQGHLPLDQVGQSPIQPGLKQFQGWGIASIAGKKLQNCSQCSQNTHKIIAKWSFFVPECYFLLRTPYDDKFNGCPWHRVVWSLQLEQCAGYWDNL